MSKVKLFLDKRRAKNDGTYPLVFRIRHQSRYCDLPTGYTLTPEQFNHEHQRIVGDRTATKELTRLCNAYTGKLAKLMSDNDNITIKDIRQHFTSKPNYTESIEGFWKHQVKQLLDSGKSGNARVYHYTLNRLSQILDLEQPFEKITLIDLIKAESVLLKDGVRVNTISKYMRTFRALYNKAIDMGIVDQSYYPFKKYRIKKEATLPKPVSLEKMREYFSLDLKPEHPYYTSWLAGMLMYMLRGINLKDLLLLSTENIRQGRIIYQRSKTKKIVSVYILPKVQDIFDELQQDGSETLLGILDVGIRSLHTKLESMNRYYQIRKRVNTHLKKIGTTLQLESNLTSYSFRYSWANIARSLGYSKDMISEALSHSYGSSVTSIYLDSFDLNELDEMNEAVCKAVL